MHQFNTMQPFQMNEQNVFTFDNFDGTQQNWTDQGENQMNLSQSQMAPVDGQFG